MKAFGRKGKLGVMSFRVISALLIGAFAIMVVSRLNPKEIRQISGTGDQL